MYVERSGCDDDNHKYICQANVTQFWFVGSWYQIPIPQVKSLCSRQLSGYPIGLNLGKSKGYIPNSRLHLAGACYCGCLLSISRCNVLLVISLLSNLVRFLPSNQTLLCTYSILPAADWMSLVHIHPKAWHTFVCLSSSGRLFFDILSMVLSLVNDRCHISGHRLSKFYMAAV